MNESLGNVSTAPLPNEITVSDLDKLAVGLNIEGGDPCKDLLRDSPNALWVNLVMILDRPLIDNVLFQDLEAILKKNNYSMLENTVDCLNEHQMLVTLIMIVMYYIDYRKTIFGKTVVDMLIYFHQDKIANHLIDIFDKHLCDIVLALNVDINGVRINYETDDRIYLTSNRTYKDIDILFSFSQCAGLSKEYFPGKMIIPTKFIPYHIQEKEILLHKTYTVLNDLSTRMPEMIKYRYRLIICELIKTRYTSANTIKAGSNVCLLEEKDFIFGAILQVSDLWNPTDPKEKITLIS